jgi:hypothetical protein
MNSISDSQPQQSRGEASARGNGARRESALNAQSSLSETAGREMETADTLPSRILEDAVERFGQATRQLADAAQVYNTAAWRIADEVRSFADTPLAALEGLQDVSRAWTDWLSRTAQVNLRLSQDMLRARSLPEVATIQARLAEESLAGLRDGTARMLEVTASITKQVFGTAGQS